MKWPRVFTLAGVDDRYKSVLAGTTTAGDFRAKARRASSAHTSHLSGKEKKIYECRCHNTEWTSQEATC